MTKHIILALAFAAISTGAAAQTKTPIAPMKMIEITPSGRPGEVTAKVTSPPPASKELLDGCIITAIGRLPKADGLRVTNSSYAFLESNYISGERTELYDVFVSVDLNGRQTSYGWRCLVYGDHTATLHAR